MKIKKYYPLFIILGIALAALAFYTAAKNNQNKKSYSKQQVPADSSQNTGRELRPSKSQPIEMH